ncbi:MAG: endonuclease/exonuclease/phosphatase family protein [Deltaproteobacteria bacterium]|nr:endonuclease/exonuclease/phosphatase family protein [Deltaproteobacteria bacterium]
MRDHPGESGRQWIQGSLGALTAAALTLACSEYSEDLLLPAPSTGGQGGVTSGGSGGTDGGTGGVGGAGGTGGAGGSSDLGWPLDDSLPTRCSPNPPDTTGTAWTGWGNFQHPQVTETTVGTASEGLFGRTYRQSDTPGAGQAPGWQGELAFGPYGTLPTGEGRCWDYQTASFNVDVGNDDEYSSTLTPAAVGLVGLMFRYRPPGGTWRYGDLDGSDSGIAADQAALLSAIESSSGPQPLIVASLNLRCRLDDWNARLPLVVQALARIKPDVVAFQEDCIESGGPSQAAEIGAVLSTYTHRGYEVRRETTHQATSGNDTYDEGVSLLSAHHVLASHSLSLPYTNFPRKALAVDVVVRGQALRVYSTHFDYGTGSETERTQSAEAIVADLPGSGATVVAGDFNADPGEPAIAVLAGALTDLWTAANPSQPGRTFPASSPTERIDYLFGSADLSSALLGAKLLDEQQGGVLLSDHFGVAMAASFP